MRYVLAAGVLGGVATGEPVASEPVKILTGGFGPTGSAGRPADPVGCCRDSALTAAVATAGALGAPGRRQPASRAVTGELLS